MMADEANISDLDLNDDEEEKHLSRLQGEEDSINESEDVVDLTEKSLTVAMEHCQSCIQLSTQNKINIKNAFSLDLIQQFTTLLKKKYEDMQDFSSIGYSLDAGVKIYACRVDGTYGDAAKLADDVHNAASVQNKKRKQGGVDEEDKDSDKKDEKDKKKPPKKVKPKKPVRASDVKQINADELDPGDELYYAMKVFRDHNVTSSALFDSATYSLSILGSGKVWRTNDPVDVKHTTTLYPLRLPDISKKSVICPSFRRTGQDASKIDKKEILSDSLVFKASQLHEGFDINYVDNIGEFSDSDIKADLSDVKADLSDNDKTVSSCADDLTDYQYFDCFLKPPVLAKQTVNSKHWMPFSVKVSDKDSTKKAVRISRKKAVDVSIEYNDNSYLDKLFDEKKIKTTRKNKRRDWKLSRTTAVESDLEFFVGESIPSYFSRCISFKITDGDDWKTINDDAVPFNFENITAMDNSTTVDFRDGADPTDFCDDDFHHDTTEDVKNNSSSSKLQNSSLCYDVAAAVVTAACSAAPLNVVSLKAEMWDVISEKLSKNKPVFFSEICRHVLQSDKFKGNALTLPTIFNALLHLSNAKRLIPTPVKSLEENDNLLITRAGR